MAKEETPRALTTSEAGVLDLILSEDWEGADQVREMLRDTRATLGCDCGCGSLDLSVAPASEPLRSPSPVPAEAVAEVEGQLFNALLFVEPDRAYLEFLWSGDPAMRLPQPGELQRAQWEDRGNGLCVLVNKFS